DAREAAGQPRGGFAGQVRATDGMVLDVLAHRSDDLLVLEFEPAASSGIVTAKVLAEIETAAAAFEDSASMAALLANAAREFRNLTGYDRVMIYRFLEDGSGVVLAEDRREDMHAFMNHHFPASDIPKQARALYVRNTIRVIPDVGYTPAPLRPTDTPQAPLDMSDCGLRSVSPVHIAYLHNMGVQASASISIIKDGELWGLVACHNETPRAIGFEQRAACRALAGTLSRGIKSREEADIYRERIRLRSFEDDIVALLSREGSLDDALSNHLDEVRRMLDADCVAVVRGRDVVTAGSCPGERSLKDLVDWLLKRDGDAVFATNELGRFYDGAGEFGNVASGMLSITLSAAQPWVVMWFRAERLQVIDWAGNPHKGTEPGPGGVLNPRASFDAWRETVRGRSLPWSLAETESAGRLRIHVSEIDQNRRLRELNEQLMATVREKDHLLTQKQFLIGEVNHRVQNSLQLVSSFLAMQARESNNPELQTAIEEARRRLSAVSLVHRRLYRADQFETVDAARYIEELLAEQVDSMGADWGRSITRSLSPVIISPDRAVSLGLIVAELVTNAQKYAYAGAAGPLHVALSEDRTSFRLSVQDRGVGRSSTRKGFGTRMMDALVGQLGGSLRFENRSPGLEAVLTAPIILYPKVEKSGL
ncbi:histidine kinase dimerization/phosphoacceptor domain -containing protein, partial [Terrihabitans rhizophilus]